MAKRRKCSLVRRGAGPPGGRRREGPLNSCLPGAAGSRRSLHLSASFCPKPPSSAYVRLVPQPKYLTGAPRVSESQFLVATICFVQLESRPLAVAKCGAPDLLPRGHAPPTVSLPCPALSFINRHTSLPPSVLPAQVAGIAGRISCSRLPGIIDGSSFQLQNPLGLLEAPLAPHCPHGSAQAAALHSAHLPGHWVPVTRVQGVSM